MACFERPAVGVLPEDAGANVSAASEAGDRSWPERSAAA